MTPTRFRAGRNSCVLFLLILLSQYAMQAQPPEQPVPQTLPELLTAIENVMERQKIPGLMLSIVTKDSVIFSGGLGYSDLATQRKADGQQKFRLGSTTKMMVAMAILHLVHREKISLDTKLRDIAPEIPFHNPWEETHPVKIIHLLEHTTGFRDAFMNKTVNLSGVDMQGIDLLKFYQRQLVSQFKPGTMPAYNNLNYTVLGYLIEQLTAQPWAEYITKNVLLPIGMDNTDFRLHVPDNDTFAQGYLMNDGKHTPVPSNFSLNSNGAHGSMNSCADDMTNLIQFFLKNWKTDSIQWLPPSMLDEMEIVHTTLAAKKGLKNGYGLGNHIETWHPKVTLHGHGGSIQGFLAHMVYDREKGIGMAIAKNGGYDDAQIGMLIMDFLTRDMKPVENIARNLSLDSIQPFLGYYRPMLSTDRYGFLTNLLKDVSIRLDGNNLLVKPLRGWPLHLSHTGNLNFRISFEHDELYSFGYDEDGNRIFMSSAPRGGTYFAQTSFTSVFIKRCLAVTGVLVLVFSVVAGVLSIILIALKKLPAHYIPIRIMPMLAVLGLACGLWPLINSESYYLSFTEPNGVTIIMFFGMLSFVVFALLGLAFLYARWKTLTTKGAKIFFTFTSGGMAILAVVFLYHGMISPVWNW